MKNALLVLPVALLALTTPLGALSPISVDSGSIVEHGGGCRKNSPPGQCCHAGSQPYHCH